MVNDSIGASKIVEYMQLIASQTFMPNFAVSEAIFCSVFLWIERITCPLKKIQMKLKQFKGKISTMKRLFDQVVL